MHSLMLFYQGSTTCTGKSQMFTCRWTRRGPPPVCTRTASLMRCWISRSSQECFGRSEIASVCENLEENSTFRITLEDIFFFRQEVLDIQI